MKKLLLLTIVLIFAACGNDEVEVGDTNGDAEIVTNGYSSDTVTENTGNTENTAVQAHVRADDVVYSLLEDEEIQSLAIGTSGGSEEVLVTPFLVGAGDPTFNITENPLGGNALKLTFREQTWHAVDIVTPEIGLNLSENSYKLTVRGNIARGGDVTVSDADTYATIFTHASAAGNFVLTGILTEMSLANAGERGYLRLGVNNTGEMEIYEIEFARIEYIAPAEIPERAENVLWSLATDVHLQNSSQGNSGSGGAILGGTPYLQNAGSPSFTIVANPIGGNAIRVSNRAEDWHTIDIMVNNMVGFNPAVNTYTIRFSGRIVEPPEESTADIMGSSSPWGRFAAVDVSDDGEFTVTADNVNAETIAEAGASNGIRIAASNKAGESDFYIYEIEVSRN
jgi:hypothetical protein